MMPVLEIFRTLAKPVSPMYTFPEMSAHIAKKLAPNWAKVAGPPSPLFPPVPVPAYVEMIPVLLTFRTLLWVASMKYTFPDISTVIPSISYNRAKVAAPPSPLIPLVPVPAKVVMMPALETIRIL